MNIKHTCRFLLDKEKNKQDAKIRYRIKWNNNKNIVAFNVGYRVEIDEWSLETQRCKNNTTHGKKNISASIINREIQRFETAAEKTFAYFELKSVNPGVEEFRKVFLQETGKKNSSEKSFFNLFDDFVRQEGYENSWAKATYQKMATVKSHLLDFDEDLNFEKLNENELNRYVEFLRDTKNMRNRTIGKQIGLLKWFLSWSARKNYNANTTFRTFKPRLRTEKNKVVFLEWDELMKVYDFNVPEGNSKLNSVKDVFCFCCFTGLRYSDAVNLKRSNVFDTHISVTTIKTADTLKIELNKHSKRILDRYKDFEFDNNLALPAVSNQKMNSTLKELCKLCGIDELITITYFKGSRRIDETYKKFELISTHTARRTFICNALMFGISPQIIMKWTGHSDYNAMKPYIEIADKAKEQAMRLFDK